MTVISFAQSAQLAKNLEEEPFSPAQTNHARPPVFKLVKSQDIRVHYFGEVRIMRRGKEISNPWIKRHKIQSLMALLLLNDGHDVSQERIINTLWPHHDPKTARSSLYTAWSYLRQGLKDGNEEVPYFIRHQQRYRMNTQLVTSDVQDFQALCHELTFSNTSLERTGEILSQITSLYAGDFMPSHKEYGFIIRYRSDTRLRLLNALMRAATRLHKLGEGEAALYFIQEVLKQDPMREDAYYLMARIQSEKGRRSHAMKTYFACRRVLQNELGIDPSADMNGLYASLLNDEQPTKTEQLRLKL